MTALLRLLSFRSIVGPIDSLAAPIPLARARGIPVELAPLEGSWGLRVPHRLCLQNYLQYMEPVDRRPFRPHCTYKLERQLGLRKRTLKWLRSSKRSEGAWLVVDGEEELDSEA